MNIKPLAKTSEILIQELEKELLVYDLKTNKAYCLNETSAMIFQLCDGKRTVAEISNSIAKRTNQLITEELVWLALDGLKKDKLLEESEKFEINFNGLTRRQVIRKVGLASLIALPIVSSVIAPSAAMAASSALPFLAACSTDSQCASGNCAGCQGDFYAMCPSSQFCCLTTPPGGLLLAPGGVVFACTSSCPVNAPSSCCSNQAIAGPNTCGISGTINCVCA